MKNEIKRLWLLAIMMCTTLGANSLTWTAPEPPSSSTLVSGETYALYNVKAGRFLTASQPWGTRIALKTDSENTAYPSLFRLTDETAAHGGWTFQLASNVDHGGSIISSGYMFRDSSKDAYVDGSSSRSNIYWVFRPNSDGSIRIQSSEDDATYGSSVNSNYNNEFMGWNGDDYLVYTNINPSTEGVGVDWLLYKDGTDYVDMSELALYSAKLKLYKFVEFIDIVGLSIDYTIYTDLYYGDNTDAINAASAELVNKIKIAQGTNIKYSYSETKATVISGNYIGDIVIPCKTLYNGEIYDVTAIGQYAFQDCSGLTSITIPNSVTSISRYAFNGCTGLKNLIFENGDSQLGLGYNASGVGKGLFYDCPLETLYLGRNISYNTDSSYGYSPFYGRSTLTSVTIPNSVTSIGERAFQHCSGLTSVIIGSSVTSIGNYAFDGCTSLTSVTIPNSVTSIGNYAFWGCI